MRRRIWGWYFFDWASQPFSTLLMTFIFAPYIARILGDGATAQTVWGYGLAVTGAIIAVASPLLGAVADRAGGHMRFLVVFSVMYVAGSWGLWWAAPDDPRLIWTLVCFGIGMIGMELATVFTNALLPGLAGRAEMGRISGSGWAFGYLGGLVALMLMLLVFQTADPPFGLDPAAEEGTRVAGPLTAIWYLVFMIPFFAFVRGGAAPQGPIGPALRQAWPDLRASLSRLPGQRSLVAFLASSMLYRDALNGIYAFGGIYAVGVLGWEVRDVGIFGILAALSGAVFAWIGGRADSRFGPRPVIATCLIALILAAAAVVAIGPGTVFGFATDLGTPLFFALGAVIGAAGGAVQAASRTMVLDQADPARMTEAFGLFALSGKATAFLAPLLIGIATQISGSQRIGIVPVIALFLGGLILLCWVKPHRAAR
ncbi:MFS transporter [Falsirhodobacter halotolerans]|uniref:MFS transporter n=1 Tax=Falsirhodobacter halotolerans TaxID=1146892 RepID=UPI001FD47315|nr:MFS transporter [Falsirhodobacter halotolerans]MCJ8138385.1 MFS transporter [Falsirhodobacter halotolerans]